MKTYSVIDIETTGLNSDISKGPVAKIIKMSCVKVCDGKIVDVFDSFVKNRTKIPKVISEITRITDEDVKDAPSIKVALKSLKSFIGDSILVAHNIKFDYGFIDFYGKKYGIEFINPNIDTLQIAKDKIDKNIKNYALYSVADYYCIEHLPENSMTDAILTALIFIKMKDMYGEDIEKYVSI